MLGKLLDGRYQVLQVLSAGGFGETYIAEDTRRPGNPRCVVKHLKPLSSDPNYLQTARRLFRSEAETLEQLGNHDQIPRLLAYFEEEQEFYLVQEFIVGRPLSAELLPSQPWSESQVMQMLEDVLGILAFVHSYGVIHRDIKPDNLIRRASDGKLVLIDFGAVKQVRTQLSIDGSQVGGTVAIGTPGYVPREQVLGRPRLNSDLYALGIIGIQALTGLFPSQLQEDPTTREILWQHRAQVSAGLAYFLSQMVRSDDRERYQSATEALATLQQLTSPCLPTQLPTTPPILPTQSVSVPPSRQNTPPVAAASNKFPLPLLIAGIAVALGVGVAIAYIQSTTAPRPIATRNLDPTPRVTSSPDNNSSPDSTPKNTPLADNNSSPDSTPTVTSSPLNTTPASSSNEFDTAQFPKETCGDSPPTTSASQTQFYPVFIEYSESNLQTVKSNFCADAYKANRKDTGQVAIQVASFTNRDRAELFTDFMNRKLGSGEVGQPTIYSANPNTETPSQDNCSTVVSDPESPLNVRSTPDDTLDNIVGTLEDGTPLTVVTEQNDWLQISSPVQGWISKKRTKTVCQ
jgi:serine/threonine protein kinase